METGQSWLNSLGKRTKSHTQLYSNPVSSAQPIPWFHVMPGDGPGQEQVKKKLNFSSFPFFLCFFSFCWFTEYRAKPWCRCGGLGCLRTLSPRGCAVCYPSPSMGSLFPPSLLTLENTLDFFSSKHLEKC